MGDESGQGGMSKIRGKAEAHADVTPAELKRRSTHVVPSISLVNVVQVLQQLSNGGVHGGRHGQKKRVINLTIRGKKDRKKLGVKHMDAGVEGASMHEGAPRW